jgi:hypothetical protein
MARVNRRNSRVDAGFLGTRTFHGGLNSCKLYRMAQFPVIAYALQVSTAPRQRQQGVPPPDMIPAVFIQIEGRQPFPLQIESGAEYMAILSADPDSGSPCVRPRRAEAAEANAVDAPLQRAKIRPPTVRTTHSARMSPDRVRPSRAIAQHARTSNAEQVPPS